MECSTVILGTGLAAASEIPPWWDVAWSTWGLVGIGLGGTIAAIWTLVTIRRQTNAIEQQLQEMRSTTDLIRHTATRQLRAYVCVNAARMQFMKPGVPRVYVELKNCGQTPAYEVRGWVHTWFTEYPLKEVLPNAPHSLSKGKDTLAPGRRSTYASGEKPPIPPQYLSILGTPKFTMYVYGEVSYKDIFGCERTTRYRLIHGGYEGTQKAQDSKGVEYWLLKPDTEGNEAC